MEIALINFIAGSCIALIEWCLLQDHVKDVEKSVTEHDTYKTTYHTCLDQILSLKQELSRLSDPAGGKDEAKKKLDKLKVNKNAWK